MRNAPTIAVESSSTNRTKLALWYIGMLSLGIGLILAVLFLGERLLPTTTREAAPAGATMAGHTSALYHVLLSLVSIILLGRWLGKLFLHFGQPRVIGEMVAGIMLGPSLLGSDLAGGDGLHPAGAKSRRICGIIAQIGVILYMFLVGLELNAGLLRSRAHATVAISHASIVVAVSAGRDAGAVALSAAWHRPTCRSRALRCSWAWRCRSRPFRCWRAS